MFTLDRVGRYGIRLSGVVVITSALIALTLLSPAEAARRSTVVAAGHVTIQAVSKTTGKLTKTRIPSWVVRVATHDKWALHNAAGKLTGYVRGLKVSSGYYVADATSINISNQGQALSTGAPHNVWVLLMVAPHQGQFSKITGNEVINAYTRQVMENAFFANVASK